MRKLLIVLSVVLAVALCQSIKRPTTIPRPPSLHPFNTLYCTFGSKKVNGTEKCKTKEEFFQHPRNETNCTKLKILKCYTFKNDTACLCVRKFIRRPYSDFPRHRCRVGFVWRCKRGNINCECIRFGSVRVNNTSRISKKCKGDEVLFCPKRGKCICKKERRDMEPILPDEPDILEP